MLVVDADPDLRELAATWLRLTGVSVRTAADVRSARAQLADPAITCVLVDLPPDAATATEELLATVRSNRPDCRTVVTSVLDAADYPAADAALPKPFSRLQLVSTVVPAGPVPGPRRHAAVAVTTPAPVLPGR